MADTTYRERILARQLASHKFDEEVIGKPLEIPQVNFTISLEKKIQALSGPPYYIVRARRIEIMTDQLMEDLAAEYGKMINKLGGRPAVFARKWKKLVESWPLDRINDLIEKHNMYYPVEADLRMDPKSGAPMMGSGPWKPREKITAESLLDRFPPHISSEPA